MFRYISIISNTIMVRLKKKIIRIYQRRSFRCTAHFNGGFNQFFSPFDSSHLLACLSAHPEQPPQWECYIFHFWIEMRSFCPLNDWTEIFTSNLNWFFKIRQTFVSVYPFVSLWQNEDILNESKCLPILWFGSDNTN